MKYFLFLFYLNCFLYNLCLGQAKGTETSPNILIIIADDMSKTAGVYGGKVIKTPGMDNLAKEGILFEKAFCTASSCTPSRASILTGKYPHELYEGANLYGPLSVSYPNYTRILADKGYSIGLTGKGWGPGNFATGGYKENPAGPKYDSFEQFISQLPKSTPFCYWIGPSDPHRPYSPELKKKTEITEKELKIPAWLPDNEKVREDLFDYYAEVKRFDEAIESAVAVLKKNGKYENTLIIITSDNGMPFPRAKANSYDEGTNIPLIMRWGNHFKKGTRYTELVSLVDLAPTILEVTNTKAPSSMTGKSLLPLLVNGNTDERFNTVFIERERHANIRKDSLSYPMRVIRTKQFLFIQNLRPERWPAGDPDFYREPAPFGDIDDGHSKKFLVDNRFNSQYKRMVDWSLEKRPAEELYDITKDPDALNNLAGERQYRKIKKEFKKQIKEWRKQTGDPSLKNENIFDRYRYDDGRK